MELPRRRGGAYEPRSAVGNILAPTSAPQSAVELRTTPSTRGNGPGAASRPPWATELDSGATPPPSARPPSASRPRSISQALPSAGHGFEFPSPAVAAPQTTSFAFPGGSSWEDASAPWPGQPLTDARPQSGTTRTSQADQLDLWTQQRHPLPVRGVDPHSLAAHGRESEGLYARVEHTQMTPSMISSPAPSAAAVMAVAGRRPAAATVATAAPSTPSRSGGTGTRLQGGDLGAADAAPGRAGASSLRGGSGTGRVVGVSPARGGPRAAAAGVPPRPSSDGAGGREPASRSTSTPKARPAAPPKRSTSITDNVRCDWVDVGPSDRKPAGPRTGSAGNSGSTNSGARWDADPEDSDRGSWLLTGDPAPQPALASGGAASPPQQQPPPRQRPGSAGRGVGGGKDGGPGGSSAASAGPDTWHAPRRTRPQSPSPSTSRAPAGVPEATLSPTAFGTAAGGVGGGGVSLGHGVTAGMGMGGANTRGGGGAKPGTTAAAQAESARQLHALQDENVRLREQVEHLQKLLTASPGSLLAGTQPADSAGRGGARTVSAAAAGRPTSAAGGGFGASDGAPPTLAAAAVAGVTLQQYKSQVIQLQRQVALMSREIEAKSRLGLEAEGVLLEVASRLGELTTCRASARAPEAAAATALDAGGGIMGESASEEPVSREQLLQLQKWSKQMLSRLRSEKSQSSKLFTQQPQDHPRGGGGASGPTFADRWSDPHSGAFGSTATGGNSGGVSRPTWEVPFISAGGNRFLLPGSSGGAAAAADDLAGAAGGGGGTAAAVTAAGPSVASIACGGAALLADPLLAHRLELQMAALAPRLAALAVLLRTQVLPAMPWLGLEAADRLQAEVGEAAEGVAQCADSLVALCSLLPAGAAVFGDGPVAQEPKRRAAEVDAGRDSWLYGNTGLAEAAEPPSPVCADDGVLNVARLQAAIGPLLRDRKTCSKALADILEPLRARTQSAASKRAVLESELRFACRASSLHAEHVSHLMMSVGMVLEECRDAKDAAAIKSYFTAAAAVRQVLEAADALEVHPCETCLKALVDAIRQHRGVLDRLPELLVNTPAADVEGRLLSKVEELHEGFKKAMSRLEAQKRRYKDALTSGAAQGRKGAAGRNNDGDDGGNDESDDGSAGSDGEVAGEGEEDTARPAAAGPRPFSSGSASDVEGGAAPWRLALSSSQQRQQQRQQHVTPGEVGAAPKPGKPPKPRAEWQG